MKDDIPNDTVYYLIPSEFTSLIWLFLPLL